MRLSWNEIRARAASFAESWAGDGYESGQTQLFYQEFFDIFGVSVRRVASFEAQVEKLDEKYGFIDLFWKGVLLVEQKSIGRDLKKAKTQALDYFPGLKESELPRYLLLSDFQGFELYDLNEGEEFLIPLSELPKHVEKFGFIMGVQKRTFKDQDPVNIKASNLVGKLHDALKEVGYTGHDLEQFLVRTVFCLFADDTGIFDQRGIFLEFLEDRTREDGSDLGGWLAQLFQILNTPEENRPKNLDSDLARFPYVNGDLFRDKLLIPPFDSTMRTRLIDACQFDWSEISPAIFGALFQSVMDADERRAEGAHYTTEKNILKVIEPLFLTNLKDEFKRLKARRGPQKIRALFEFQEKLAGLRFFDPACGCGNFLIITYRELRLLEIEVLKEALNTDQYEILVEVLSIIDVNQFYGIEISEFPARIAETALWMMDHIMNNQLSLTFGKTYARIPLEKSPHIHHGDALETDWSTVLRPDECSFVLGNPPFIGAKLQTNEQRAQVHTIAALGKFGGTLDYVTAWFIKAGEYVKGTEIEIGFVATSSITQGDQVAQLWPTLFDRLKLEISFAHRSFVWGSDAPGMAHVYVVIIGLVGRDRAPKDRLLFSYEQGKGEAHVSTHTALSPYLFSADDLTDPHLMVKTAARPENGLPRLIIGSKPIDGGHYIFTAKERQVFLEAEPGAAPLLRPYIGTQEFLNNGERSILALHDTSPSLLATLPLVRDRVAKVRGYRLESKSKPTRDLAATPLQYHVNVIPTAPFLVMPKVNSNRREYMPISWLEPPTIPSDLVFVLNDANKPLFGILTSTMHMAWLRHIGGRLGNSYRYSIGLVYNTFPMPDVSETRMAKLEPLAEAVLDARAADPESSLAELYDPDSMPTALRRAHQALDRAVDRLYRKSVFPSERARIEHLLTLYEKTATPLEAAAPKRRKRRRSRSVRSSLA